MARSIIFPVWEIAQEEPVFVKTFNRKIQIVNISVLFLFADPPGMFMGWQF